MKEIAIEQLNEILENHKKWLYNEGGERADLHDTDLKEFILKGVDLRKANLNGANLSKANLEDADLRDADLRDADLEGANLSEANLEYADLRRACLVRTNLSESNLSKTDCTYANLRNAGLIYANLREAFLKEANLVDANLRGADLVYADLTYSDLSGINLKGANLNRANLRGASLSDVKYDETTSFFALQCPEKGSFIGYKKAGYRIVELLITEDSLRSSATSRKCRCSKAKVLSITDFDNTENFDMVASSYDERFIYKVGEIVEVRDFDENRWNECSTGIHFFITRQEAINY